MDKKVIYGVFAMYVELPENKAWQRQITPNAAYSTKKLLEELEQIFTENEK